MDDMNDCTDSRRSFLQSGGCFMFALAVFGLGSLDVMALPISEVSSTGSDKERQYPLPAGDGVSIDHQAQVILVRFQNHAYAFALSCPHENAALKWVVKDMRFQCTKHDSRYQPDGVHTTGRATRNMDRFVIRRDGESIVVDLLHWFRSDQNPSGWGSAAIQL
jgi:nitrite reductase/ring-hydroxylating ferredoxin subunit